MKLDTFGAKLDDDVADPLLETRRAELAERDRLRAAGDPQAAGKAAGRANKATEELGVRGAKDYMKGRDAAAELVSEGKGPGTFDLVYKMSNPPPDFVVIEAKGGSGTNSSSRQIGKERYQQGHPDYAEDVLGAMVGKGKLDESIAGDIAEALEDQAVEYIEVKQAITKDGGLGTLSARQYDLDIEEGA